MPEDVYLIERLVIQVLDEGRERSPDGAAERVIVRLNIKNPIGSLDSTRRPPGMELRDSDGYVYTPANDEWADTILPDTEMQTQVIFEVAPEAQNMELVLAPGDPEEVHVPLSV